MLLAAGAELSPLNNFGTTPLEEAILSDNLHAAETLIRAGAPVPPGAREMAERKCKVEFMELFKQIPSSRSQPEARRPPPPRLITLTEEGEPILKRDRHDPELVHDLKHDRSPIQLGKINIISKGTPSFSNTYGIWPKLGKPSLKKKCNIFYTRV